MVKTPQCSNGEKHQVRHVIMRSEKTEALDLFELINWGIISGFSPRPLSCTWEHVMKAYPCIHSSSSSSSSSSAVFLPPPIIKLELTPAANQQRCPRGPPAVPGDLESPESSGGPSSGWFPAERQRTTTPPCSISLMCSCAVRGMSTILNMSG